MNLKLKTIITRTFPINRCHQRVVTDKPKVNKGDKPKGFQSIGVTNEW